ncbi:hypothetical protein EDC04DRAFT_2705782, partial [Pisolithus marmoratus]
MVDVEQCPGCCDGPSAWTTTSNDFGDLVMPGLMKTVSRSYLLLLDLWPARLDRCSGQQIELGDYGDYSNGILTRAGNMFEDMRALGIDTKNSAYRPVVSCVSGSKKLADSAENQAVTHHTTEHIRLVLRQPKGFSLPANEHLVLQLKVLSTHLTGKCLVISIIQCSDFSEYDKNGKRGDSECDSAPSSRNRLIDAAISTPLYGIARPQVWKGGSPCVQRREQFRSIREQFYALVRMVSSFVTLAVVHST